MTQGRVLIIAGSDSGGGAGIQADIKAVTLNGGYAMTAITALTAQNTLGVTGIHPVPLDFIVQQITAVLSDIGADGIKTGMLHSVEVIECVADALAHHAPTLPRVIDPVMVATSGSGLVQGSGFRVQDSEKKITDPWHLNPEPFSHAFRTLLIPQATVLTPNIPEAEALTGLTIRNEAAMLEAAHALRQMGARHVLLKGGHLADDTPEIADLLLGEDAHWFRHPRITTRHTHGTGCTLASALAAGIARGLSVKQATEQACDYVHHALLAAPGFGKGHGPVGIVFPV
jgi:hydroxymethylpyrimidine/phosphomethylpyrimidine kinase